MKMLINVPETVVADALRGMAAAHPELTVDVDNRVVVRRDAPVTGKVGLVSGGGSGHEPLHGGFVGPGMLSAACPGEVFTSPVPDQMVRAAAAVDSGAGVLFIVKNYTGDVLNFDMAAELAEDEGVQVAKVLVNDDVAVTDSLFTAGRRGVGATLFVEKMAGALAEEGAPLERVEAIARQVNENSRSFGVALSAVTTPAKGSPTFDLPEGELELGIGIHGEPGRERRAMMTSREIADFAVDAVLEDLRPDGSGDRAGQRHGRDAAAGAVRLQRRGPPGAGRAGRLGGPYARRELCDLARHGGLLGDVCARSTRNCCGCGTRRWRPPGCAGALTVETAPIERRLRGDHVPDQKPDLMLDADFFRRWLVATAAAVEREADRLTELDSAIGDADHGSNLQRGFRAVTAVMDREPPATPGAVLTLAGRQLISTVGGASGPLYGTLLRRTGKSLGDESKVSPAQLAEALGAGVAAVAQLGGAKAGDKTMIDALEPAVAAIEHVVRGGGRSR